MTVETHSREIHRIFDMWSANKISYFEKDRMLTAADDREVAECQAAIMSALAEASARLPLIARQVEALGYADKTVSAALVRLLNCKKIALTPARYVYLREVS